MPHELIFSKKEQSTQLRLAWITDLHLDAAEEERVKQFIELLKNQNPDGILIGGDISNGIHSLIHLKEFATLIPKPFYFVLGNHDYYFGSIRDIRELTKKASEEFETGRYLTDGGVVKLTPNTALIGHDGWSDARAGDFLSSTIMLHDYLLIDELKDLTPEERMSVLNGLGKEAADALAKDLKSAFTQFDRVILLIHTPPFQESCRYDGEMCDENWAPHFVCKAVGDMLVKEVGAHPEKEVLVLCGHSHYSADQQILPNLRVLTGHCELGKPSVTGIIEVG